LQLLFLDDLLSFVQDIVVQKEIQTQRITQEMDSTETNIGGDVV
jgi:hypothetical protein